MAPGRWLAALRGPLRFGKLSGQGRLTASNGSRYEGAWRDGEKNGQGIFVQGDGGRYEGRVERRPL